MSQAGRGKPRVRNQFFRGGAFLPLNKFRPELILGGSKFNVTGLLQLIFHIVCSPNTYAYKGVFNPNIPIYAPNSAECLHFSAFHINS